MDPQEVYLATNGNAANPSTLTVTSTVNNAFSSRGLTLADSKDSNIQFVVKDVAATDANCMSAVLTVLASYSQGRPPVLAEATSPGHKPHGHLLGDPPTTGTIIISNPTTSRNGEVARVEVKYIIE